MWLPATRIETYLVPQHEGCREIFELLFLSGASFVSPLLSLPTSLLPVRPHVVVSQQCPGREGCSAARAPSAAVSTSQTASAAARRPRSVNYLVINFLPAQNQCLAFSRHHRTARGKFTYISKCKGQVFGRKKKKTKTTHKKHQSHFFENPCLKRK